MEVHPLSKYKNTEKFGGTFRDAARYSHLGITYAATILLCLFGGQYLDKIWNTKPYLTLVGALFGASAGFYYIIKELTGKQNSDKDED